MAVTDVSFVGQVASVSGGIVRVRLSSDMPTTLVLVEGESYRVGQVGAFFRIPLGYTHLYGVCTQVGADALPSSVQHLETGGLERGFNTEERLAGFRWMTLALFGESVGGEFERGVGQYPTVGDEVHLVTDRNLEDIYRSSEAPKTITVGSIAASTGIPARIDIERLVSRHSLVVGSTGAGKSNLVTTIVEEMGAERFPSSRVLIVDPHGEYPSALRSRAKVFKVDPDEEAGEERLRIPFWALSFTELVPLTFGALQPNHEAAIRDRVYEMKRSSATHLADPPSAETITADSPIPFSIRELWFELDDFERQTFSHASDQNDSTKLLETAGDAESLTSSKYTPASPYNQAPYKSKQKRNIDRQLDLMKSRLSDARFSFLFDPGDGYTPAVGGAIQADLDQLVEQWVGHDKPVTVIDVSGLPSEVVAPIVGTLLSITYDMLFWAGDLPVSGTNQPLLVVLEEAHLFLPEGGSSPAHRSIARIAKEGRKYGVGLMLVSQRPSDLDSNVLSQSGTVVSLRLTNAADRSRVASAFPDDLGGLVALLPALRTGEGLFVGEAIEIPSRVRVRRATNKAAGNDPVVATRWALPRPDGTAYRDALKKWRAESGAG